MNALQRLERGGFIFDLTDDDGRAAIRYTCADDPPHQWAGPLLAEVAANREEVMQILQARLDWAAVYDVGQFVKLRCAGARQCGYLQHMFRQVTSAALSRPYDALPDDM